MDRFLETSIYVLGFIGLVGVTLIPLRSFYLLRSHYKLWRMSLVGKLVVGLLASLVIGALVVEAHLVWRVFHCLIGDHCGPNRASGWIYLAGIGIWYLVFEGVAFLIALAWRFAGGSRPNNSFKPKPLRGSA